jgi:hypothetical protein
VPVKPGAISLQAIIAFSKLPSPIAFCKDLDKVSKVFWLKLSPAFKKSMEVISAFWELQENTAHKMGIVQSVFKGNIK